MGVLKAIELRDSPPCWIHPVLNFSSNYFKSRRWLENSSWPYRVTFYRMSRTENEAEWSWSSWNKRSAEYENALSRFSSLACSLAFKPRNADKRTLFAVIAGFGEFMQIASLPSLHVSASMSFTSLDEKRDERYYRKWCESSRTVHAYVSLARAFECTVSCINDVQF